MKKHSVFIITFFLVFIFCLYVFSTFWKNIAWSYYLNKWEYEKAELYLSDNYNLWNLYYKKWEFDKAIAYFEKSFWVYKDTKTLHNLWNSYYRYWQNTDNNKSNLEKSLEYYSWALDIKYDFETKANYDFVLDILNNLDESSENNSEDKESEYEQNEENNKSDDSDQSSWDNETSEDEDSKNEESSNDTGSWNTKDSDSQTINDILSEEDQKALEEYEKSLEENQYKYNQYYGKVYQEPSSSDDIFDQFFWASPFSDINTWWEKDW